MHGAKIVYNITVISLALHVCDVTSYDNSCSRDYCVRAMCEKLCQKLIGIFDLLLLPVLFQIYMSLFL